MPYEIQQAMTRPAFIGWQRTILCALMVGAVAYRAQPADSPGAPPSLSGNRDAVPAVLTTAEQVHRLTRDEAGRGHGGRIQGVVVCALPESEAVVVQDSTRGIYIDQIGISMGEPLRVGDLVE